LKIQREFIAHDYLHTNEIFQGNISSVLVNAFVIFSAYQAAPIFGKIWSEMGIQDPKTITTMYAIMALGSGVFLDWMRKIFK
jgi:hypothetical protein